MKRKALMVVLCVLMVGALAGSAVAGNWYKCIVNQAGQSGTVYFIQVTEVSQANWTGPRYFFIDTSAGVQNAMLATALTAWSNSGNVNIWLESTSEWWTTTGITTTNQ